MFKLVVYKKKACIYLIGGTKEPVTTFSKNEQAYHIAIRLCFTLSKYFWDSYEGIYHKGKFYSIDTIGETAKFIEKQIKEN